MNVIVEKAEISKKIIFLKVREQKTNNIYYIGIDTKIPENFIYIKDILKSKHWTDRYKTWGEVISNMSNHCLTLSKRYLIK